ncbi:MAG: endonuclease domain-containing protein [Crocinitomicaceae bacterium]|jgi:very-short-patch-repair endonuclease|nr:endonuclease domain-containing protein [Crocinitomicaceae bacterium]
MKNYNYYNPLLRKNAHELRNFSLSKAEKRVWKQLLSKGRMGTKFKRQRPIDIFIVDFFSQELKLIIEIDGCSHNFKPKYDAWRQKRLEALGFTILRFTEGEGIQNTSGVGEQISHAVYCLKEEKRQKEKSKYSV